jgi:hypothetical protein
MEPDNEIDHASHGWALLAFKLPAIRPYYRAPEVSTSLAELCKRYSIGVLEIRRLRLTPNGASSVEIYEARLRAIETEVALLVSEQRRSRK